jgi:small subunit ribosomal protein S11
MAKEKPENEKAPKEEAKSAQPAEKPAQPAEKPAAETPEAAAPAGEEKAPKKEVTAQDLLREEIGAIKIRKAKGSKNISSGIAKVLATFNNTKICITDQRGNVISWSSSGKMNFRGSRKSTAYAAQVVAQDAARAAMAHGLREVEVHLSGPGLGRDSAVRAFQAIGLEVSAIVDTTPVPHNGCRSPKRRRV